MKKSEIVYREILINVLNKKTLLTQLELSKKCNISLGYTNRVINQLAQMHALQIMNRGFKIIDANRILMQWAVIRKINNEAKPFSIDLSTEELEKIVPSIAIFTAFSAWKFLKNKVPIDYREVYVYVNEKHKHFFDLWLNKQKLNKNKIPNLYVIYSKDDHLFKNSKNNIAPLPQIAVDIYSISNLGSKYFFN